MKRLPDFLIVGAMKSATSTLHEQLARQPGFVLSTPKEPCFFSDDAVWERGLSWYASLFAEAREGDICGESSTHYAKLPSYPHTVARIKSALPASTRFIYVMRHPLQRLVSHYIHEWSMGVISESIDSALATHPELVDYGRYAWQLEPYLEAFGPERVLPVFTPSLKAHPQAELDRVCRFLGYAGRPLWHDEVAQQNISRERMRRSAARDFIKDLPGATWLRRTLIPKWVRERIKDRWRMTERPQLSPRSTERVTETFDQDLAKLGSLLGRPLSCSTFDEVTRDLVPGWISGGPVAWAK
jgi:hypothetical protein